MNIERLIMGQDLLFMNQRTRNARAKALKNQGQTVRRYSIRGQCLHPQYVEDYDEAVQTGFGNTMYKTLFPVLYGLKAAAPNGGA